MIRQDRLVSTFLDLARIDSLSRHEGRVADYVSSRLGQLDVEVVRDRAAERLGGETGNLIATCSGTAPGAPPLMLNAHLDTVVPGEGVRPEADGDLIRSGGDTVLGADDKAGVAIILEVLAALREDGPAFGDLDLVFTVAEETGLHGAKQLDWALIRARHGYALDASGSGALYNAAPSSDILTFDIHGVEAHAGVEPEKGINAIQVAAEAIARMRLGRIDAQTTANIGVIHGGKATNIVPDSVHVRGEARSRDDAALSAQTQHMQACVADAVAAHWISVDGQTRKARHETRVERSYHAFALHESDYVVDLAARAARKLGPPIEQRASGGGSDANIFNKHGIQTAILCTGSHAVHTVNEYLCIPEMVACAALLLQIVRLNAVSS